MPFAPAGTIPDSLAVALYRARERLGGFRDRVRWHPDVDSTNDIALALAPMEDCEGTVIVADAQRKGRGRRGHTWFSPPGAGIYASAVLRLPSKLASFLPLAAGVAVAEGVETATGLYAGVKWPNDVYVPAPRGLGRKLAGVLVEASGSDPSHTRVVVGFGVNVLSSMFPPDVADRGTTIETELGRVPDRGLVLAECLVALWRRYRDLHEDRTMEVAAAWTARAGGSLGRRVEWESAGRTETGLAVGIDTVGALLVRTEAGMRRVISGEVRWS